MKSTQIKEFNDDLNDQIIKGKGKRDVLRKHVVKLRKVNKKKKEEDKERDRHTLSHGANTEALLRE